MLELKVKKISKDAILPSFAHTGDAGMDIFSIEDKRIEPGETALIKTGLIIQLPEGTEAQLRPKSGLALNYGITLLNTPGTIDEGYRGEVGVILINHGKTAYQVEKGTKIAQMVIKPILKVSVREVDYLTETVRDTGGFGSTGLNTSK